MPHTMPWTTPRNTPGRRIHLPATLLATLALLAAPACTKRSNGAGGGDATTDDAADTNTDDAWFETGDATSSGTSDDGSGESTGDDGEPCDAWVGCPDVPETIDSCDFWAQDCPEGQKCTWANSTPGGSRDAYICVDAGTEPTGAPCTIVEGADPYAATDTCDATGMCYNLDPDTGEGTCVEFCVGSPDNAECPISQTECSQLGSSPLALCLPGCSPLPSDGVPGIGECWAGQECVPAYEGDNITEFICYPLSAQSALGESCECANCCAAGNLCTSAANYGPSCAGASCCTEYCDVTDTAFTCGGAGQECLAMFEPTDPHYANVGACMVP